MASVFRLGLTLIAAVQFMLFGANPKELPTALALYGRPLWGVPPVQAG